MRARRIATVSGAAPGPGHEGAPAAQSLEDDLPQHPRSRASIACFQDAGFPILIAVAIVLGSATRSPRTMGAAPSAWKPSILGSARAGPAAAAEAPPRAKAAFAAAARSSYPFHVAVMF